jgi:hypothetical protein
MKRNASRRGFTVVEGLIGVVVGALVLSLTVSFLISANTAFHRSDERTDPRDAACRAMYFIRALLTDAWAVRVMDPRTIKFQSFRLAGEIRFDPAAGNIMLIRGEKEQTAEILASGISRFFAFQMPRRRGIVGVGLEVKRPDPVGRLKALAPCRIVDQIVVHSVAMRKPYIPWRRTFEHKDPPWARFKPGRKGRFGRGPAGEEGFAGGEGRGRGRGRGGFGRGGDGEGRPGFARGEGPEGGEGRGGRGGRSGFGRGEGRGEGRGGGRAGGRGRGGRGGRGNRASTAVDGDRNEAAPQDDDADYTPPPLPSQTR